MDPGIAKVASGLSFRVLKEPRGFIRLVQFFLSIFAFATTCGFSSYVRFTAMCGGNTTTEGKITFEYPFSADDIQMDPICGKSLDPLNFASSAQFFVATGLLSFLYTLAIVAFYVAATRLYEENQLVPAVDLLVSAVLTLFWFAGSCAWANGLVDLKYYTSVEYLKKKDEYCSKDMCKEKFGGNFAGLNVSIIFGFANVAVWVGSLWFVYKETAWHQQRQQANNVPNVGPGQPPVMTPPPATDYSLPQ